MKRVFLLHLVGNAILIGLLYLWLGIRDARALQILATVVLGAILVAGALYLHAGTWHWMRTSDWRVPRQTLIRFAAGILIFILIGWLLSLIPVDRAGQWTASLLTFKTRKPINPGNVTRFFRMALWIIKWFVVPVVILGEWKRPKFWLIWAGVLLVGWYIPQRLVYWTPDFKSTTAEVVSVILRWGLAYVLATVAWLFVLREAPEKQLTAIQASKG